MLDPKKIVKVKKTSQKGALGLGKPNKSYLSMHEEFLVENAQFEDIDPSIVSEETPAEIHKAPCPFSSPLDLNPKKESHMVPNILMSLSSISFSYTTQSANVLPHIPVMVG